ncbi:hypothetical protein CDA63_20270, partial [Hymenobacter amundsenii]
APSYSWPLMGGVKKSSLPPGWEPFIMKALRSSEGNMAKGGIHTRLYLGTVILVAFDGGGEEIQFATRLGAFYNEGS